MLQPRRRMPGRHLCLTLVFLAAGALATGGPAAAAPPIPVDGHGLPLWETAVYHDFPVRIELAGRADLDRLLAAVPIADFERDQIRPEGARLVFTPRVTEAEAAALVRAGFRYERLEDLEQQGRRAVEAAWAAAAAKDFAGLDPAKALYYPTHAQIGSDLAALASAYPGLARTVTIGTSVQGRELWGIVISDDVHNSEAEPEVRLTSTIHGDEPVGMVLLWNLAHYLLQNYGQPGYENVTELVDNTEIHIMPLHNPDGYVAATRYNSNGVDLNRNFPLPAGTDPITQTENLAVMAYGQGHHFVVSQNGHGGALVVNYPWDYTVVRAPDDAALIDLSLEYSTYNLPMYNGSFSQGITNGYDWYQALGTLQDWSYSETDCIDVTVELGNTKWPAASQLDGFWDDNRESLLHYVAAAHYGINGVVTGSDTGLPLNATVSITGNTKPVHTDPAHGDYYKLLPTGTYQLVFSAPGYLDEVVSGVATTWGTPTVLDVVMDPVAHGDVAGAVTQPGGQALDATIAIYSLPLDQLFATAQSDAGSGGAWSASLPYGDYRLEASAPDHATVSQTVTIGATPVTADFVLGIVETIDLFASDFEVDAAGWSGDWGLGATGHNSSGCLTDSPSGNYTSSATTLAVMDAGVDLSDVLSAQVSFWATWNIEDNWDACFFEVSTDGGTAWTPLGTAYTGPASGQGGQTPGGAPCFDGIQSAWALNTVDLAAYLGQTDVRFRFRLATDTSIVRDGYSFDDFAVTVTRTNDLAPVPTAGLPLAVAAFPNPFNPGTTVAFTVPQAGLADLRIFDVRGRLVRILAVESLAAGTHERAWDGRDERGAAVGSGVYFAQARVGGQRAVAKLMLVK